MRFVFVRIYKAKVGSAKDCQESGRRAGINPAPTWRLHEGDNAARTGRARVAANDFACRQLSACAEGAIGAKLGGER